MNFNKRSSDSLPADAAGGINQEWNILIKKRLNVEQKNKSKDMEEVSYNVDKKRVYYPPYTLDPSKITFDDVFNHATVQFNTHPNTATKNINLAKIMETHPIIPVNFRDPHWHNFFQYMDYIKQHEGATPHMLKNRRNAWNMFCRAWGVANEWPKYPLPHIPDRSRDIVLPSPEVVNKILSYKYTNDKYLNKLIQYHFFTGFMIGMRPESEMVILDISDISIDDGDFYTIHIVEPKKRMNSRTLRLEDYLATSKTTKSFKNYIDTIRPKFADASENALLVNPVDGKRWTEANLRKSMLSKYGRQVWPKFWPYVMRHWCATARCIEWAKEDHTVLNRAKEWLGHKKTDQTLVYTHLASLYNQNNGSWLRRALKRRRGNVASKLDLAVNARITQNKTSFVQIPSENLTDAAAFVFNPRRFFARITKRIFLFVQGVINYSLKPSGVFV